MKRILYYTIFILCAAACGQSASQEESASAEYETMTVSRSDISLEETYPASIEGRQSIRIIPRVEGYLQEIKVKEGQRVKKGQVLFVLDQAHYVAEEKAARANVEVAKAGVILNFSRKSVLKWLRLEKPLRSEIMPTGSSVVASSLAAYRMRWSSRKSPTVMPLQSRMASERYMWFVPRIRASFSRFRLLSVCGKDEHNK